MLSKRTFAIFACFLMVASFFVYGIYAAQKKEKKDPKVKGANTSIQVTASLTLDTGGVTGYAKAESFKNSSYGSMYLYATVARQQPKSKHIPFYGVYSDNVKTLVGVNNRNNQASAVANDYYNNQQVNALVRGRL